MSQKPQYSGSPPNPQTYSNVPLHLDQPFNLLVYFSLFSPIILVSFITSLSFIFQNVKGLVYLGFVLGVAIIRYYIYYINNAIPSKRDSTICSSIQYTSYGNSTFSSFIFAFTAMYLFLPMFMNSSANYWLFSLTLVYFFADIFIKQYKNCYASMTELILNILLGCATGGLIVMLMYIGKASKFLFFNEMVTDKEVCSKPKNSQFKCQVYKNGELLADM